MAFLPRALNQGYDTCFGFEAASRQESPCLVPCVALRTSSWYPWGPSQPPWVLLPPEVPCRDLSQGDTQRASAVFSSVSSRLT